jgi:hypothetical protein
VCVCVCVYEYMRLCALVRASVEALHLLVFGFRVAFCY